VRVGTILSTEIDDIEKILKFNVYLE